MKIQFNKEQLNHQKRVKLADIVQIQSELGLRPLTSRTIGFFYYNFPNILELLQLILNQQVFPVKESNISQSNIINVEKISPLKEKYELSIIIYAVLLALFQVQLEISPSSEGQILLKRNIILHHQLNSSVVSLQILIEKLFTVELAEFKQLNTYCKIKGLITENLNAMKLNNKQKVDLYYAQRSTKIQYQRQIQVKDQTNLSPDYFQINYSNQNSIEKDAMSQFFQQAIVFFEKKQMKQMQIRAIMEQVLLTLGIITFYQTIKSNHQLKYESLSQKELKQIAMIQKYNLMIQIVQGRESAKGKKQMRIHLSVIFQPKHVQRVKQAVFMHEQIKLKKILSSKGYSSKYVCMNDLVYQIDTSQILSKSDVYEIYKGQSLQLQSVTSFKNKGKKSLCFIRKSVIIKAIQIEKIKDMVLPEADETIILNLLRQLKHKQQIKSLKMKLHFFTQRSLIGIDKLINVIDIFRFQKGILGKEQITVQYLVFQEYKQDLMKLGIKQHLMAASDENRARIMLNIFKQIAEGLICLHFDIQQLYPVELNHYYNIDKVNKARYEDKLSIYYGNIKPSNIMINYLNDITFSFVTIIGFSKSKISKNNEKDYGIECNSLYAMAPEAKNVRFNNEKIDIWGFGVMLLEMINQGQIIQRKTLNQQQSTEKQLSAMQVQSKFNQKWFQMLNRLLRHHPKERLDSKQLLNYIIDNEFYLVHSNLQTFKKKFKGKQCFQIVQKEQNSSIQDMYFKILHYNDKIWPEKCAIRLFTLSSLLNYRMGDKQGESLMIWMVLCFFQFMAKGQKQKINFAANVILLVRSQQSKFIVIGTLEQKQKQPQKRRLVSALQNKITIVKNTFQLIYKVSNLSIINGRLSKQLHLLFKDTPFYRYNNDTPYYYGYTLTSLKDCLVHFKLNLFCQSLLQNLPCYKKAEDRSVLFFKRNNFHEMEIVFYKVKNFMKRIENVAAELIQIMKDFKGINVKFDFDESQRTDQSFIPIAKIKSMQNQRAISMSLSTVKFAYKILSQQSYSLTTHFRKILCSYIKFQLQEINSPNFQQIYKLSALLKAGSVVQYEKTIQKIHKYAISPRIIFFQLESTVAQLFIIINTIEEEMVKRSLSNLAENLTLFTHILSKHVESIFKVKICMNLERRLSNRTSNEYLPLILDQIKRCSLFLNNLPTKASEKDNINYFASRVKDLTLNIGVLMYLFYQI